MSDEQTSGEPQEGVQTASTETPTELAPTETAAQTAPPAQPDPLLESASAETTLTTVIDASQLTPEAAEVLTEEFQPQPEDEQQPPERAYGAAIPNPCPAGPEDHPRLVALRKMLDAE